MTRLLIVAALGAVIGVAGCSPPSEPARQGAAAGKLHEAGLWETRVFIGGEQMPDVARACVRSGAFDPLARFARDAGCAKVTRSDTARGYTFTTVCTQDGVTSRTTGSAEFSPARIVIATRSSMDGVDQAMHMRLESRKIGPCPAGTPWESD
ncbi:MAG: DUF3617 family protein [Phenylobacterium sp.]|uniref:DUF3617 domain-containing protein n=1 Tax=Phenylobacterium sp. TaxID=1871053 RepID=UPI002A2957CF|nr:DUF3617 family protein [Phenylobacterium sp.]MDD3837964.1 DUF3617 family protein [Phenylobacterium sp.]MDX9996324.1 DUF3617 family protein [Phenylobacterium sp.]